MIFIAPRDITSLYFAWFGLCLFTFSLPLAPAWRVGTVCIRAWVHEQLTKSFLFSHTGATTVSLSPKLPDQPESSLLYHQRGMSTNCTAKQDCSVHKTRVGLIIVDLCRCTVMTDVVPSASEVQNYNKL